MSVRQERIDRGLYWGRAWSLVEGCTPMSPGCLHCWSARQTHIRAGQSNPKMKTRYGDLTNSKGHWTGEIRLMEQDLTKPLTLKKPTTWAIWNDLFHPDVPPDFIRKAWMIMKQCPQHTFLVLTKRPRRMKKWITKHCGLWNLFPRPLVNVYVGTTVENRDYLWRVNELSRTPAAVRFVSLEPLLAPIDLHLGQMPPCSHRGCYSHVSHPCEGCGRISGRLPLSWVVVGAESGPGARFCKIDWMRNIVQECVEAKVSVFVKQMGTMWAREAVIRDPDIGWRWSCPYRSGDRKGTNMSYWPHGLRVREFPRRQHETT